MFYRSLDDVACELVRAHGYNILNDDICEYFFVLVCSFLRQVLDQVVSELAKGELKKFVFDLTEYLVALGEPRAPFWERL